MKFIFAIFATLFVAAQTTTKPLSIATPEQVGFNSIHLKYADSAILRAIDNREIPGAVLAVVSGGKMAYLKAYGNKSVYPNVVPMSTNTIFDMASCSKAISTAVSIMILVERGELRLFDNVDIYIPKFKNWVDKQGNKRNIRVIDLLKHTSGLPAYASIDELHDKYGSPNPDGVMDYISTCKRYFEPTTDFRYSCLNYIVLQNIVETVAETTLRDFAKNNIFMPLGMVHTDYLPLIRDKDGVLKNIITPTWLDCIAPTEILPDSTILCGHVHDPLARIMNGGVSGNAGVFSDANDMAIFANMLLDGGVYNGVRILSPLGVKALLSLNESLDVSGDEISSPYSASRGELFGNNTFGHTGYTGTSLFIDPDSDIAVIFLTNTVHLNPNPSIVRLRALVANCVAASLY